MSYIIQIEDTKQSKSLIQYLSTLKFVKIINENSNETKTNNNKPTKLYELGSNKIDSEMIEEIITSAENSKNIPLNDAIKKSDEWKNKL